VIGLGKKRLLEIRSGNYDSADFFEGSGKSSFERPIECTRIKYKTFTEKSFEHWSQYVCGTCKHLVFRRQANSWVCDKGHSITKESCVDWVDDILNTRIRMPDGCLMYVGREES
jgi:hypothetical protein